jgi:hypothetical protein
MSNNKGIPTVGVRGIQFRSRIEAHWAYIFEKMGWIWDYEPIDLYGYIPDFIIKFGEDEILIEIKGETNIWKREIYEPHKEKIIRSGWKGHYAILGSAYEKQDDYVDGLVNIGKYGIGDDEGILLMTKQDNASTTKLYSFYLIGMLTDKNLYHKLGDGCWDDIIDTYEDFSKVWVEAKNRVQNSIGPELYDEIMELCHKLILLQTPANQYKRQRNKIMDMIRNNNCMII